MASTSTMQSTMAIFAKVLTHGLDMSQIARRSVVSAGLIWVPANTSLPLSLEIGTCISFLD
jgi:hypothetical protein